MQFKVNKSELLSALKNVGKAVSAKSTMKCLEGVLFTLSQNELKLTGYDLMQGIETVISAESFDTGKFIVDAKLLTSVIGKMPKEDIDFAINDNILTLSSGKTNFTLNTISAEEYPALPDIENAVKITVDGETLKSMINQTIFAVAVTDTKPVLTGELLEIANNELSTAAIDGYRIAVRTESVSAEDIKAVIPSQALRNVAGVLSGNCDIYISNKHAKFVIGDYSVFTRLLEGEMPDYKKLIPTAHTTEVVLNTREVIDSIERCQLLVNERIKSPVRIVFKDGQANISLKTTLGKINDVLSADVIGDIIEIGFNTKYLLDALKAVESDKVKMYLSGANKPMVIKDDGYVFLVLPVRLKGE